MATHSGIFARRAWWATIHGVAKSWTRLKQLSSQGRNIYSGPVVISISKCKQKAGSKYLV